ncbi:MAG: class I SAM-dependent methyltransferase [Patescibacteria group bacterium]|jgi:ubiquinone/menaquinone biosynthesis C-methylase UbiE
MIYERGNAAKQDMLEDIACRFGDRSFRVLDLAGGSGRIWQEFLTTHPNASIVVIDTDKIAIAEGKKMYEGNTRIELRAFDAQKPIEGQFDVVSAMSAIEHVVDRPAFLKTAWNALVSGGVAYMNYDVGHFRSRNVKERIMVYVSQLLAFFKIEGPYMKKVDDVLFRTQAETQGFIVEKTQKHNLANLKGLMKGATDEAIRDWVSFEKRLNELFSQEKLDRMMLSTTLVLKKP